MACVKNENGEYLFPQRCWCVNDPHHLCCKNYNQNRNVCASMIPKKKGISFPVPDAQTMSLTIANGILSTSWFFRIGGIIALIVAVAFFLYSIFAQKSLFFPKTPSNFEINKQRIKSLLNKK